MHKYILTLLSLLILTICSNAQEKKLKYEKLLKYEGVTITKITPTKISIIHKAGVTSIPIEDLPKEIRENLGMTSEKAEEQRDLMAKKKAKAMEQAKIERVLQKNRLIFSATVFQVTTGGVLLRDVSYSDGTYEKKTIRTPHKVRSGSGPTGLHPNRRYKYTTKYKTSVKSVLKVRTMDSWPIFVECDNTGYVDGADFTSTVYTDGTFAYNNTQGARKTIPAYTTDALKVLKRNGY